MLKFSEACEKYLLMKLDDMKNISLKTLPTNVIERDALMK